MTWIAGVNEATREIVLPFQVPLDDSPCEEVPNERYTKWFGGYRLRDFWGCLEDDLWDAKAEGYMGA